MRAALLVPLLLLASLLASGDRPRVRRGAGRSMASPTGTTCPRRPAAVEESVEYLGGDGASARPIERSRRPVLCPWSRSVWLAGRPTALPSDDDGAVSTSTASCSSTSGTTILRTFSRTAVPVASDRGEYYGTSATPRWPCRGTICASHPTWLGEYYANAGLEGSRAGATRWRCLLRLGRLAGDVVPTDSFRCGGHDSCTWMRAGTAFRQSTTACYYVDQQLLVDTV